MPSEFDLIRRHFSPRTPQTLLAGGSPATPEELRKRFDMLISERGKGKDASKLRFVIE